MSMIKVKITGFQYSIQIIMTQIKCGKICPIIEKWHGLKL